MASCEKCWSDAYLRHRLNADKSQAEYYQIMIEERKDNPCTPEQQAGEDAEICPKCDRKTMHQYVKVCMNCGYKNK